MNKNDLSLSRTVSITNSWQSSYEIFDYGIGLKIVKHLSDSDRMLVEENPRTDFKEASANEGLGEQTSTNEGLGVQTSTNEGLGEQTSTNEGLGEQTSTNEGWGVQTSTNEVLGNRYEPMRSYKILPLW